MLRKSIEISAVVVSAILMALACASSRTEKSTGTNWIECRTDADCASVPGATCKDREHCVDGDGKPVEVPVTDAGGRPSGGSAGSGGPSSSVGNGGASGSVGNGGASGSAGNGGASGFVGSGGASGSAGDGGSGNAVDCEAAPQRETDAQAIATVSGVQGFVDDSVVAGDGSVGVLWREFSDFSNSPDETKKLVFSRQKPGSAWGQPEQVVATNDVHFTGRVALPFSQNRPTVVFWTQGDDSSTGLKASLRAEDGTWKQLPVVVETTEIPSYSGVVDSTGNLTVVWTETDSDALQRIYLIRSSTLLAGSDSWTPPEKLTTGADATYIDGPMVQILDNDNVVVLWSGAPTGWATWSNVYDPARKAWGGPTQLSRKGEYRASLSSSGNRALAVWAEQNSGSPASLFAARYENGRWSTASTVQAEAVEADDIASAITPNGDALAMWQIDDSSEKLTYSVYRTRDGAWAKPAVLEYPGAARPSPSSVTWVDCRQAFLAVWKEYDAAGLYSAWYTLDGGWSNVVPPWSPTASHAVDTWGNLLAAWYDGDDNKIYFQTLTP